jgi:hypothetical protein
MFVYGTSPDLHGHRATKREHWPRETHKPHGSSPSGLFNLPVPLHFLEFMYIRP